VISIYGAFYSIDFDVIHSIVAWRVMVSTTTPGIDAVDDVDVDVDAEDDGNRDYGHYHYFAVYRIRDCEC